MPWFHFGCYADTGVLERGDVERLADAVLPEKVRTHHVVRVHIGDDAPIVDHDHSIHITVQHILQAVFNDNDRLAHCFMKVIDDLDGNFAGGGVQVCQRFVKEQNVHIIDHHACKRRALFCPPESS